MTTILIRLVDLPAFEARGFTVRYVYGYCPRVGADAVVVERRHAVDEDGEGVA